jgi:hypothetical protein
MMTYEELCRVISAENFCDFAALNALIDDLTRSRWVVRFRRDGEIVYRVNFVRKNGTHNESFWNRLGLEHDSAHSPDEAASDERGMRRGGKRTLPKAIWDTLEQNQRFSRDSLFSKIVDGEAHVEEHVSDRTRVLRKRLYDALDAISDDESR